MNDQEIKQKIYQFLNENPLGVISTIHAGKNAPESAVVGFGNTKDLELVFGTSNQTRKYQNLQVNPSVAFVVGWSSTTGSLQYEGKARELSSVELDQYEEYLLAKNKNHEQFFAKPGQRYFLVTPTWIRFQDNASNPPETHEITVS